MTPGQRSQMRADALMGRRPGGQRSVLANRGTNMEQTATRSPGPAPEKTAGSMSARNNPFFAPAKAGPPPFDAGIPDGAGTINRGKSQPSGAQGHDELPLRHRNVGPHGRRR